MVDTDHKTALILQNCLDAIQSGKETLDSVLDRYPELEDELRPELENAIWLTSHQSLLDPDPQFIRQSRQRLVARIQSEQSKAVAPSLKSSLVSLFRMPRVVFRIALTLMMIFILLIGADRLVETTSSTIPGDPGYSVKRSMEDFTLAVSSDPGQQIVLHLEFSQRRLTEVNTLMNKARYVDANQTLDEFEEQVRSAVTSLDSVKDEDTVHKELLAITIQNKLSNRSKQLSSFLPKVPSESKPAVNEALMVSSDGQVVAQTAIKRLMIMQTPQPSNAQLTPTPVSQPTQSGGGVKPTFPPLDPTATAQPTTPTEESPTPLPTDANPATPVDTPVPSTPVSPTVNPNPTSLVVPGGSVVPSNPTDTLPGVNSVQPSSSSLPVPSTPVPSVSTLNPSLPVPAAPSKSAFNTISPTTAVPSTSLPKPSGSKTSTITSPSGPVSIRSSTRVGSISKPAAPTP